MGGRNSTPKKHTAFTGKQDSNSNSDSDSDDELIEICDDDAEEDLESCKSLSKKCKKCPDHHAVFTAVSSLQLEDLPQDIRSRAVLNYILAQEKLVVKVTRKKKSKNRPQAKDNSDNNMSFATGYAWCTDVREPIPCPFGAHDSHQDPHHQSFGQLVVYTNEHVIYDDFEARASFVQFFYDSTEQLKDKTPVTEYGCSLREHSSNKDLVGLVITSHDPDFYAQISAFRKELTYAWERIPNSFKDKLKSHAIIISHPHGAIKQVSFGQLTTLEQEEPYKASNNYNNSHDSAPSPLRQRLTKYSTPTCSGSSGAPVLTGHYPDRPFTHSGCRIAEGCNFSKSY